MKLTKYIMIILALVSFNYSQQLGIRINNNLIKQPLPNNLSINSNDEIGFYFLAPGDNEEYKFDIFLNGKIIQPDFVNKNKGNVKFKNLEPGNYIFKVLISKNNKPLPKTLQIRFFVSKNITKKNKATSDNMFFYILIFLILIQLVIIIVLFARKNKFNNENSEAKNLLDELKAIKETYEAAKTGLKKCGDEKSFLNEKISDLKKYVSELENANTDLISQKESLLNNKRELEELQKQKDELFAITVHDIKNPASAIKGLIELLESYDLTASEQQEIMQTLVDSTENIMKIASQMTEVISKGSNDSNLDLEKASLKNIIDSVVKMNQAYANKKGIKLLNRSSGALPEIVLDKQKIKEVIDNLINNAIKYGPEGTIVEVRAYFSETKITIEINDTGVGLSEHDVKLCFSKGVTLSSQPTGKEHRSGLGLWIAKKIIEEHKGEIWVKSKLGIGSTFGFDLPLKQNNL